MSGFQMLIGSTPKGIDLTQELHLVKIGLLYADSVTLCSPGALMLSNINELGNLSNVQRLKALLPIVYIYQPALKQSELILNIYFSLLEGNRKTKRFLINKFGLKEIKDIEKVGEELRLKIEEILQQSGFLELEKAFNSNKVILKSFQNNDVDQFVSGQYFWIKNGQ